ncbi:MAG: glycosyltransferase [Phycisphaeraceae bacterium]|nr:MAG: glycosyltransferase [Phycisphaeraceae bacterium]
MNRRYVLISPCRDEARFMKRTLDSVIVQSQAPGLWVIVDDGSSDESPAILAEYAAKHPWIRIVRREDRGGRAVGPGVIEAFYAGLDTVDLSEFDYLCKLDLDLDLPERYFEALMDRMEAEPRLGSCSGKPYYPHPETGELISEGCGDEMSMGMSKFYRVSCFEQIGGFVHQVMWDGIDCHRCRMAGWLAQSWDEEELRFIHLRPMGSSQQSIWTGRMRHGYGQWFMGTGFVYMTASALTRMMKRPFVLGGAAMWWGYVRSMALRLPRYEDREFRRFLRRYQWMALLKGKAAAVKRINREQTWEWKPPTACIAEEFIDQT